MEQNLKSGQEIIEEFFNELETLDGVDGKIIASLKELYEHENLSDKAIINSLHTIRKNNE